MIEIGLLGANGRMGKWVCSLIETEFKDQVKLVPFYRPSLGSSMKPPVQNEGNPSFESLLNCDVIIDFSTPSAAQELARFVLNAGEKKDLPAFVIGSTGWDSQGLELLKNLAEKTPVLLASNFSVGILILREVLKEVSPILRQFGFNPVITEVHHQHKKDAPSGTALTLQQAIQPDRPDLIQTHSLRAGEVIGDHTVTFYGKAEKLSLSHSAQERSLFARGAIQAALWVQKQRHNKNRTKAILNMDDFFQSLKEPHHGDV